MPISTLLARKADREDRGNNEKYEAEVDHKKEKEGGREVQNCDGCNSDHKKGEGEEGAMQGIIMFGPVTPPTMMRDPNQSHRLTFDGKLQASGKNALFWDVANVDECVLGISALDRHLSEDYQSRRRNMCCQTPWSYRVDTQTVPVQYSPQPTDLDAEAHINVTTTSRRSHTIRRPEE